MVVSERSRNLKPFTRGVPVPCTLSVSHEEFRRIKQGFLPQGMEDKWFIYYEAPFLYLHRSWTGEPFYRLKWVEGEAGASVVEMLWADAAAEEDEGKRVYQGLLADYVIGYLLLGKDKPFPRRTD